MFAKPELERQEDNDTQSILEHQLLFTLHTRLEIQKHFKEIEEAAEVNIQELIMTNKDRVKDQRKITDNIPLKIMSVAVAVVYLSSTLPGIVLSALRLVVVSSM